MHFLTRGLFAGAEDKAAITPHLLVAAVCDEHDVKSSAEDWLQRTRSSVVGSLSARVRQLLSLFLGSAKPKAAESASSAPSTQRRAASAALRCRLPFVTSVPPRQNVGSFKYAATKAVLSCSVR